MWIGSFRDSVITGMVPKIISAVALPLGGDMTVKNPSHVLCVLPYRASHITAKRCTIYT